MTVGGTILLGIVGSFVGGFLADALFRSDGEDVGFGPVGIIGSTIGAILCLLVYRMATGSPRRQPLSGTRGSTLRAQRRDPPVDIGVRTESTGGSHMSALTFGVFFPQGWKMELSSIADPQDKWRHAVDIAVLAEELGYDSLWWYDHFHNVPVPAHETVFECWTTVAAISQRTSRIRLGQMVGCNGYRNPALLAKITSTVDVISGGRLDWGIGAGWYEHEFNGYGYEFPAPKDRIGMLREAVEIVKAMWTEPDVTYSGKYYELQGRAVRPEAAAAARTRRSSSAAAASSSRCGSSPATPTHSNFGGKPHEWAHKAEVLKGHCAAVGRDYDEITEDVVARGVHPGDRGRGARRPGPGRSWASRWRAGRPATSSARPSRWPRRSSTYVDLGCTGFYPWCSDYPDTETMRLFAEQVIPHFR